MHDILSFYNYHYFDYFSFIENIIIIAIRNDTNLIPFSINNTFCKYDI